MQGTDSKIDDAVRQLHAGSVDAPEHLTLIALAPTCALEERNRIASAIYSALDEDHLSQNSKNPPVQQALCLVSLATINARTYLCPEAHDVLQDLMFHWPKLHRWVLHLHDFVKREDVDLSFRLLAKRCIGDFLGACDDTFLGDSFDSIVTSPGLIATLISLWRLEIQDTKFSDSESAGLSCQSIFRISATLDSWMSTFLRRENLDWSVILHPFDDDADALATTALEHLRRDVACVPTNYDAIVWDIHLLTTLSINENIRTALLKQRSMTILTTVIKSLVGQHTTADKHTLIAKCLSYGYWYIRAYVESTEGLSWITQVVEAGLLPVILSTEPWIKHMNDQDGEDWDALFLLLREIVPKYSVYISVLRLMNQQLATVRADDLPGKLDKSGLLFESWCIFQEVVRNRAALYNLIVSRAIHIESCQNGKCNKPGPPGAFKICAACLHVHYCSKECQVYDWKQGSHRRLCREIQFRREHCLSLPITTPNDRFLDWLVVHDLRLLRDRIYDIAMVLDANPVVVELDYKEIPMEDNVGTIRTVPSIKTCECDASLVRKWDHMIKTAVEAKAKNVLVRAFFPDGESERVKLQCIPLLQILGNSARPVEDDPMLDLGQAFEVLLSRTGHPGGDVGVAFPGEASRSMREGSQNLDGI